MTQANPISRAVSSGATAGIAGHGIHLHGQRPQAVGVPARPNLLVQDRRDGHAKGDGHVVHLALQLPSERIALGAGR